MTNVTAPVRPAPLRELIAHRAIKSVFQPIVDLDRGHVTGYEALARGPRGSALEAPGALFAAAATEHALGELDLLCRDVALETAVAAELDPATTLFVNVEPSTLGEGAPFSEVSNLDGSGLRVVVELTERALAARPAEVLATVDWLRERGCGIALDDVGADRRSLALLPFLAPDVIKLDMSLIQERQSTPASARVLNAAAAAAEELGAVLLAEGIETEEHLLRARAVGATLGQGWLLGRPGPLPGRDARPGRAPDPVAIRGAGAAPGSGETRFGLIADQRRVRRGDKRLLLALSRQLEAEAITLGPEAVVIAAFQDIEFFTPSTRRRYVELAEHAAFVAAVGAGLPGEPAPGVRGASIASDHPLRGEWCVMVIAPHFAGAFVARDQGDRGPDLDRTFDFFLTYERRLVLEAARSLMRLIQAG
jgi:EAL domain-containing protein (putative c-di-GMP-specific phosphodiesterase class I)